MKRSDTPSLMPEMTNQNQTGTEIPMQAQDTKLPSTSTTHGSNGGAALSPAVQKHIGNLLKVSYQELLTDPVPDRFANLLDQLEQAEKKGK